MSRRGIDSRGEKAIGVFLDKYFYPKAYEQSFLARAQRIYKKMMQLKGVDVIVDEKINVDEKAQLYYINRPVASFAFEIDYFSEDMNSVVDGWYINDSNETDEYLLMWIREARTDKVHRLVAEDFECIEANLIKKNTIKSYISQIGFSDKMLKQKAIEMRNQKIRRVDLGTHCHLTYSMQGFSEMPINIVIDKIILDELSKQRFVIRKEDIKQI